MDGFLFKRGEKGMIKTFKKRWFVLDESRKHLYYYKPKDRWHSFTALRPDISKLIVAGRIDLKAVTDVNKIGYISSSRRWRMTINRPNRTYILESDASENIDKWVETIRPSTKSNRSVSTIDVGIVADSDSSEEDESHALRERAVTTENIVDISTNEGRNRSSTLQYLDSLMEGVKDGKLEDVKLPPSTTTTKPAEEQIQVHPSKDCTTELENISLNEGRQPSRVGRAFTKSNAAKITPTSGLSEISDLRSAVLGGLGVSQRERREKEEDNEDGQFESVPLEVPSREFNRMETIVNLVEDSKEGQDGFLDMDDIQMEGFLLKRSRNVLDRWQRRYFMVDTNGILYYHSRPTGIKSQPSGVILYEDISAVKLVGPDILEIVVPTRVYELQASTDDVRQKWVNALGVLRHMKLRGSGSS